MGLAVLDLDLRAGGQGGIVAQGLPAGQLRHPEDVLLGVIVPNLQLITNLGLVFTVGVVILGIEKIVMLRVPLRLIEKIADPTFQIQASLQYEGGLRAEGVGAPSNRRLQNPLTTKGLRGTAKDPVTGKLVGIVAATEKGGKEPDHYVSLETYSRLEEYILAHQQLESNYCAYVEAINQAAKSTGQYARGRGSHGLKHNFAQERYLECVSHGFSHEQALQQTSLETSHFRMRETLTYTSG